MSRLVIALVFATAACQTDETVSAYSGDKQAFNLVAIDGAAFAASATIDLSQAGRIQGTAPCNQYFAGQTAPYPWFEAGPIGATRMACPDLAAETAFFEALGTMTFAEVLDDTLLLSNSDGREMLFQSP